MLKLLRLFARWAQAATCPLCGATMAAPRCSQCHHRPLNETSRSA